MKQLSFSLCVIDTVAVALRILARWKSKTNFGSDDSMIALSLIPLWSMVAIGYLGASTVTKRKILLIHFSCGPWRDGTGHYELGTRASHNILEGTVAEKSHLSCVCLLSVQVMMSGMIMYSLTITMVKLSLLLLYRRLFATASFRKRADVTAVICVTWFFVATFTNVFQCRPFNAAFRLDLIPSESCIDLQQYLRGIAIANLALDFVILVLPLHMIWNLNLPARQRNLLLATFLLGSLCVLTRPRSDVHHHQRLLRL